MQILNAGPRFSLTIAQVQSILTGNQITYTPGLELLDGTNNLVSDISNYLVSGGSRPQQYLTEPRHLQTPDRRSLELG